MEKFLQAALVAWNPIGEVRRRMNSGNLSVDKVLVPFIVIIIACRLFAAGSDDFLQEVIINQTDLQVPSTPFLNNDFALRFMSVIDIFVVIGIVSLLPSNTFHPVGRSPTLATIIIVTSGWAFYGAAIGVLTDFISAVLITINTPLGFIAYYLLQILVSLIILGLIIFFWLKTSMSILGLKGGQVLVITIACITVEVLLFGLILLVFTPIISSM